MAFLASNEAFSRLFRSAEWRDINLAKRLVMARIDEIKPLVSELYSQIRVGEELDTTKPFWLEEHHYPREIVATLSGGDTLTVTGNLFGAAPTRTNMLKVLRLNAVLRYDSAGTTSIAEVTAVDDVDAVVTIAASSGTSVPSNGTGQIWTVIGEPATDAEDASNPRFIDRQFRYTTSELFTDTFSIEETRKGTAMEGVKDEMGHQMDLLLDRQERLIASAILCGWPKISAGEAQSTLTEARSRLCGIDWWPEYFFGTGKEFENAEILMNLNGAALDTTHINTHIAAMDANGSKFNQGDWRFVVRPEIADYMQDYNLAYLQVDQNSKVAGVNVEKVRTKRGVDVKIQREWYVPRNTAWFLDLSKISVHPFKGMGYKKGEIASLNITSETWQIVRRLVGVVLRMGPVSIGKIKNIAMSA